MIKTVSILISLISIVSFGWITPVQTICKVELKNGEEVEGFVSIFNFSSFNYFERGFLITRENYEQKFLFSLDFVGFQIEEREFSRKYFYGTGEGKSGYLMDELLFIEYEKENEENSRTYKSDIDLENKRLTQREEVISNYKILDTIDIFQELPKHQNLLNLSDRERETIKSRKIATKDIKSFQFERKPSKKWLNKIPKKNSFLGGIWWNHEIHNKPIKDQKSIRKAIRQKLKK